MKLCKNCNEPVFVAGRSDYLLNIKGMVFHIETNSIICDIKNWRDRYKGPYAELKDEDNA